MADSKAEAATSNPKKTPGKHKSLCNLLHYFVGVDLSVELKTGRIYKGSLSSADAFMNLELDDATIETSWRASKNNQQSSSTTLLLKSVHIRGSNIRYLHFPDDLDFIAVIRAGMDREQSASAKYQRGKRSIRSSTTGAPSKPA